MSVFRRGSFFWYIVGIFSLVLGAWTYKILLSNGNFQIYKLYHMELSDISLLAFVIPVFMGIVLKEITGELDYSKLLCHGNRLDWLRNIIKNLIRICVKYSLVLLGPMSLMAVFVSNHVSLVTDATYILFTWTTYTFILIILAFLAFIVKCRWGMDVIAILVIMFVTFFPYLASRTFIRQRVITFSDIMNSSYLFTEEGYLWIRHELMCIMWILLAYSLYAIMRNQIIKMDILWRQDEN